MFNSQILDVAIGLVTVYFFLSVLCSAIIEIFTSLTKKRARMLSEGILSLLQDPKALHKLYEQPLFMGNSTPKNIIKSLLGSFVPLSLKKKTYPSYISSRSFVLSLLESLKQHPDVVKKLLKDKTSSLNDKLKIEYFKDKLKPLPEGDKIRKELLSLLGSAEANPASASSAIETCYDKIVDQPDIFKEILKEIKDQIPKVDEVEHIKTLVSSLSDDNAIKKAVFPLLETVGTSVDKAIENMEKWYDEAMERVTGWYKRYSQTFALILAFVIAFIMNADSFQIGKAIYRDQQLRNSLVGVAEKQIKEALSTAEKSGQGEQPKPGATSPSSGRETPGKGKQAVGKTLSLTPSIDPKKEKASTPSVANQSTQSGQTAPGSKPQSGNLEDGDLKKEIDKAKKEIQKANKIFVQISSLNLPIGWPYLDSGWPDMAGLDFVKFLGILLTALMVSLGSNFWFELLSKLINMRNAGKKPLTREEQNVQKK